MNQKELNENYLSAANNGYLDQVREYIKQGADINAHSDNNFSAIAQAAYHNQIDVVKYLSKFPNIDLEISDSDGSALLNTIKQGHFQCAKALLEAGANVNARNPSGRTVLMETFYRNLGQEWIDLIFSHDPDLTMLDDEGHNIHYYAGQEATSHALEQYSLSKQVDIISFVTPVGTLSVQDIFDFNKGEKITIIRKSRFGDVEAMTCEAFDRVSKKHLRTAFNEHKKRGGKTAANDIGLIDEMDKSKLKSMLPRKRGLGK